MDTPLIDLGNPEPSEAEQSLVDEARERVAAVNRAARRQRERAREQLVADLRRGEWPSPGVIHDATLTREQAHLLSQGLRAKKLEFMTGLAHEIAKLLASWSASGR
jgi:hypothetical protein